MYEFETWLYIDIYVHNILAPMLDTLSHVKVMRSHSVAIFHVNTFKLYWPFDIHVKCNIMLNIHVAFSASTAELLISSDNDLQIFLEVLYQKLVQVPEPILFYKDAHMNRNRK